jgi:caa(3)-type oxidase subunit IV
MSTEHHPEAIHKQVSLYWKIFGALTVGTVLTVAVSFFHGWGVIIAVIVALIIAAVKGSLVAGYFMHLFHEVKWIHGLLVLTAVFFVALIALVMWTAADQQGRAHGIFIVPQKHVEPAAKGGGH